MTPVVCLSWAKNKVPQTIYFFALQNSYNYKMILKVILPSEGHFSLLSDLYPGQAQVQNNSRHFFCKICELKSYQYIRIQPAAIFVKDKQLLICKTREDILGAVHISVAAFFSEASSGEFPLFFSPCLLSKHEERPAHQLLSLIRHISVNHIILTSI